MTLIRLELFKLWTQRATKVLLGAGLAFTAVGLLLVALMPHQISESVLASSQGQRGFLTSGTGVTFLMILGMLAVTTEYRHKTITSTFLASPRREQVVAAKLAAVWVMATIYALVTSALTVVALLVALNGHQLSLELTTQDLGVHFLREVIATAIFVALGVGIAALLRTLVWSLLVVMLAEPIAARLVSTFAPEVAKWFPSALGESLFGRPAAGDTSAVVAGAVLALYAAVAVTLGIIAVNRQDIA